MKRTPMAGIDLPGNLPLAWEALAARDAEIERLNERVKLLEGAMRADEARLMEAARLAGVGYFGCDTPEVLADTIGELRALVEKRERQLIEATTGGLWFDGLYDEVVRFNGDKMQRIAVRGIISDAGLLAAIDEATEPR